MRNVRTPPRPIIVTVPLLTCDLSNIREHCREARRKYFAAQTDAKTSKENDSAEFNKRNEEFKEKEVKLRGLKS